jgi:hypothetical protein
MSKNTAIFRLNKLVYFGNRKHFAARYFRIK